MTKKIVNKEEQQKIKIESMNISHPVSYSGYIKQFDLGETPPKNKTFHTEIRANMSVLSFLYYLKGNDNISINKAACLLMKKGMEKMAEERGISLN